MWKRMPGSCRPCMGREPDEGKKDFAVFALCNAALSGPAFAGCRYRKLRGCDAGWACLGGTLYMLKENGEIWRVSGDVSEHEAAEGPVPWHVEFNDFTEGSLDAKGYGKLLIRMELEAGSRAWVELKYDSEDRWRRVFTELTAVRKRTFLLPVIPRRADHCRLRLAGTGGCVVYSIAREFYGGSENKTVRL